MQIELTLGKISKLVTFKAEITKVMFNPIVDFKPTDFGVLIPQFEYVKINFSLTVTIENSTWIVPYIVLLRKGLNEYQLNRYNYKEQNIEETDEDALINPCFIDDIYDFFKIRALNIPLCEVEEKEHLIFLIHFLYNLDLNTVEQIDYSKYSSVKPELFYHKYDFKTHEASTKYCVKRFKNVLNNEKWYFEHPEKWFIPFVNLKSLKIEDEILNIHSFFCVKLRTVITGNVLYNVVPVNYMCSYSNEFSGIQGARFYNSDNCEVVFKGTYEECLYLLVNQKAFEKFISELIIKDIERERKLGQANSNDYFNRGGWKKDYFNAMTDGQLGRYKDFGGNIDDIDDWAGR